MLTINIYSLMSSLVAQTVTAVEPYIPMLIFIVLGAFLRKLMVKHLRKKKKRWRVGVSRKKLAKLRTLEQPGMIFHELRHNTDPFTFEEILLTAYEQRGMKIKRNMRYTGDGGIDGRVKIGKKWHLIQAKRYEKSINPADVKSFSKLCTTKKLPGLFIHTGRTGPMSREIATECSRITIVSGNALLELLSTDTALSWHPQKAPMSG